MNILASGIFKIIFRIPLLTKLFIILELTNRHVVIFLTVPNLVLCHQGSLQVYRQFLNLFLCGTKCTAKMSETL